MHIYPAGDRVVVAAGVTALLALAVTVASLGYLHLEPTGLSPVRNARLLPRGNRLVRGFRRGLRDYESLTRRRR